MSQENSTANGYQTQQADDGKWWIVGWNGEQVAGPFDSQSMAKEVAAVFQDTPASSKRRNDKS